MIILLKKNPFLEKWHSVRPCSFAYSCHKRKRNHNTGICTNSRDQDSFDTTSATNLSNNPNKILLQTAVAAVSNFHSPANLINVQVIFDSGSQRSNISDKLRKRCRKSVPKTL